MNSLHNVQTVYWEENDPEDDHEDDTLHNMCGLVSKGILYKNYYSVKVDCCVFFCVRVRACPVKQVEIVG